MKLGGMYIAPGRFLLREQAIIVHIAKYVCTYCDGNCSAHNNKLMKLGVEQAIVAHIAIVRMKDTGVCSVGVYKGIQGYTS